MNPLEMSKFMIVNKDSEKQLPCLTSFKKNNILLNFCSTHFELPVGNPRTKYLSGPGLNFRIVFLTYLAAHSLELS